MSAALNLHANLSDEDAVAAFQPTSQPLNFDRKSKIFGLGSGKFSFSYPSWAEVDLLRQYGCGRFVEIGAGSGTYARVLRQAGLQILPTDIGTAAQDARHYVKHFSYGCAMPIEVIDGQAAVDRYHDRDVLLIMPNPDYDWYVEVLNSLTPGRRLFLIMDMDLPIHFSAPSRYKGSKGLQDLLGQTAQWKFLAQQSGAEDNLYVFERL